MSKDKDKFDLSYHEPFIDTTVQTTDSYCSNMIHTARYFQDDE